jgi:hypothetical protein
MCQGDWLYAGHFFLKLFVHEELTVSRVTLNHTYFHTPSSMLIANMKASALIMDSNPSGRQELFLFLAVITRLNRSCDIHINFLQFRPAAPENTVFPQGQKR